MSESLKLHTFTYKYNAGPVSEDQLSQPITEGNCRLSVQDYFYTVQSHYLAPDEILLPHAYYHFGSIVAEYRGNDVEFFRELKRGDVIYAERLRNKNREIVYKEKSAFKDTDEWVLHLHTAVYLGIPDEQCTKFLPEGVVMGSGLPDIWHATFIANGTALWDTEQFLYYYKPVSARRLIL